MIYCRNCDVELEENMAYCPLCHEPVKDRSSYKSTNTAMDERQQVLYPKTEMTVPQKKIIWEIVSITILSIVVVNLAIDLILNGHIDWSEYPVAISLILFSYISSFAFLRQNTIVKIVISVIAASAFILMIDWITAGLQWALRLGIPLLFAGNVAGAVMVFIFRMVKNKGINLVAYALVATAFYCICIEAVVTVFRTTSIDLYWSVIVMACVLPVAAVILFVHFRLTKNRSLERIFHI